MSMITVDRVTFGYDGQPVLEDVRLAIAPGEIVALLGPNGSGKTTLLKILLGLYLPHRGDVFLDGRPVRERSARRLARRIAYVPQVHRAAFGYRVLDIVMMGRLPHKPFFFRYGRADERIAMEALNRLDIDHLHDRTYTELSGGERQLVLIARALTQGADIFVMDEPVNGLDYGNQIRLLHRIADLADSGYTFIKTTHFPDHALWVSDRVVMLKAGRVVADGPTAATITRTNLYKLYHIPVDVMALPQGGLMCVPEALKTRLGASGRKVRFAMIPDPQACAVG